MPAAVQGHCWQSGQVEEPGSVVAVAVAAVDSEAADFAVLAAEVGPAAELEAVLSQVSMSLF